MDTFDHDINFDGSSMFGPQRDDMNANLPPMPFPPSYELADAFANTYDDPFNYPSAQYDDLLESNHDVRQEEVPSQALDNDNKLLGFGAPVIKASILDDRGNTWPQMTAELYGMFFVAEDVFGGETTGRPLELTCYRRNLFQISGTMTLSRGISHIMSEQGRQIPLYGLTASLSAIESIEGKATEIISVPWKASAGTSSEDKNGAAPPKWPIDLNTNPELDPSAVSIPIAWKRLQFKHATANNGRRKGLQQHYLIQINLIATLATGEVVKLAEIQSGPIIVRGRSPRNFDSRKDVPLNEKKMDTKQRTMSDVPASPQMKVDPAATSSSYRFYAPNAVQKPLDLPEFSKLSNSVPCASNPEVSRPSKRTALATRPPVPKTRWTSEPKLSSAKASDPSPIDLSLADNEYGRRDSGSKSGNGESAPDAKKRRMNAGSPVENADLLYEYFPLSLDDWMPPVDAVYRPHVVHHIHPPDGRARQDHQKKRYFSADDDDRKNIP
ncbi:hypothetical protein BJ875DRAFT_505777 [Amylocarpus encephaloides]|uniref:NDT80 domain-containing protein n=1 Tax=Amylocarpus encephaloides TaxID=45428 RepID=A0A9P7YFQ4_9HELO|nr:hypothetical protein BJ875DRAFT_505777 [Amylocarpus encephaloides]